MGFGWMDLAMGPVADRRSQGLVGGDHLVDGRGEFGEVDALHGGFVFFEVGGAAQDAAEDDDGGGGEEGFAFFAVGVFYHAALEKAGGGGHDGVAFGRFFLVAHAQVAAGALEIHHVFVFGAGGAFGGAVVEFEAGVFLQDVPFACRFELVDDVVGGSGYDEGGVEFDFAFRLFNVLEHLGENFEIADVDHAGANEAEVHFLTTFVVGEGADGVVGVALGDVVIVDVGVGDHGLDDFVEVDLELGEVFGVAVGGEGRLVAGADFGDTLVGFVDEAL